MAAEEEEGPGCMIFIAIVILCIGIIVGTAIMPDTITVEEPLVPEIKLTVKDNVIDTLYIYKRP